jgi:F-type H+-transporting ATPase subunit epsilon
MLAKIVMEVVSPERLVLREEVDSLVAPGSNGYLGILPGHAPLVTGLAPGVLEYKIEGKENKLAISGGFMEVYENKATILADTAERKEEIDLERAKRAKERAEKRLRERPEGLDVQRAELALRRALARIKAAE